MKKILSIILTVCMLFSLVIVPVTVNAVEPEAAYEESTLGAYYKFTFGEDGDQFAYVNSSKTLTDTTGKVNYKGNDFYPLWSEGAASTASAVYKTITTSDGKEIDVLEIKNTASATFTPLTKDGQPFELRPGVKYLVTMTGYNPACNAWGQTAAYAGSSSTKAQTEVNGLASGSAAVNKLHQALRWTGGGAVGGMQYGLWFKDGTYSSVSTKVAVPAINSLFVEGYTGPVSREVSASLWKQETISIPEEYSAGYDAEKNSYSTKFTTTAGAATEDTSDDYAYGNNYLTLSFGGGDALAYKANTGSVPVYSNATKEEIEAAGTVPSVWQIKEIVIREVGYAAAVFHVGDTVTEVRGNAGDTIALDIPAAPEGKYFVAWYTDAEFTTPVTTAQTFVEGAPVNFYARFEEYGSYVKNDYTSKYPSTAIQMTSAGYYYAAHGYSFKGNTYKYGTTDSALGTTDNLIRELEAKGYATTPESGTLSFFSDRTWGMPGGIVALNDDGTLFMPEAGAKYKVTYRYRSLLNNGNDMAINVVYGIPDTFANKTSTGDQTPYKSTLGYNSLADVVPEWTVKSHVVTIPASISGGVPSIGLYIGAAAKKKVFADDGETVIDYTHTVVELDYLEVEKIPSANVNFLKADGSVHTAAANVAVGAEITYPKLTAAINYDYVWSLDANKYVPAPKTLTEEKDITVYAIQSPVISYENRPIYNGNNVELYPGNINYDTEMNAVTSSDKAYTGNNSVRLRNYSMTWIATEADFNTELAKNNVYKYDAETDTFVKVTGTPTYVALTAETIANGTAFAKGRNSSETGMNIIREFSKAPSISFSYKITFKYLATEKNTTASTISARLFPKDNIWWGSPKTVSGNFEIAAGATDGWQTGALYVTVSDFTNLSGRPENTSNSVFVLDLKFNGNTALCTNEIYLDDVTIEENYVNTPELYIHVGDEVTTVTEGLTAGGTFTPPTVEVPANKYLIGWTDASGKELTEFKMPAANLLGEYHIYAKLGTYPDNVTIDVTGATQPTLKGYSAFTSSTINEAGWAQKIYTENGVHFEKALGGANKWNPALDGTSNAHAQTSSRTDIVAHTADNPVGTQVHGGWSADQNYVLRDKNGNAIIAKPNTKYAVIVTYEKKGNGKQVLSVGMGRKAEHINHSADSYGTGYSRFSSSTYDFVNEPKNFENTYVFNVTTENFTEGDVPVISLHYSGNSVIIERIEADANGVESYTLANGTTYYPYKIIEAPSILIKEVKIVEIDADKVGVTFGRYNVENETYTFDFNEGKPGTALDVDTQNYDPKWYNSKTHITNDKVVTTYPAANATYYNATYGQLNPATKTYVTGDGKTNGGEEKEWTFENALVDDKYALHIGGAKVEIETGDVETYMTGVNVEQGHTYKVSFKYKATAAHGNFGFTFRVCQGDNFWSNSNGDKATMNIAAGEATDGWITKDFYFTIDLTGTNNDENETGIDYNVTRDYRKVLQMTYSQDAFEAGNDLYFADIAVVDLGEVITKGGASVLTNAAAEEAGQQAMRYYFNYKTIDGDEIILGDETLKVVERGFLYRNGTVAKDGTVASLYSGTASQNKTEGFNSCWAYNETTQMMTFSTYVTGFYKENDTRKLEVNAYIIVELADGSLCTIYSSSTNRSVAGVQGLGDATDGNITAGQ